MCARQLGERPNELLKLVAARLSPEDNLLLKEYDDIWFAQICRRDELIYSAALMDGMLARMDARWILGGDGRQRREDHCVAVSEV